MKTLFLGAGMALAVAGLAAPPERAVTLGDGTAWVFVEIPAGTFRMGSPADEAGRAADEGPVHEVTISRPYWLGKFEVTQAQWSAVMGGNPSTFQDFATSASHPVEGVSWLDAQQFLERLNARGVGRFRLPTEAEWEHAARAGTTTRFPWGEDVQHQELARHAWFYSRAEGRTHPVGLKPANPWGLHDVSGGVWEWCADWSGPYASTAAVDPRGPETGEARVIRGGSWFNEPEALRPANRHRHPPDSRQTNLGLRLVWEPPSGSTAAAVWEPRRDGSVPYGYRVRPGMGEGPWFREMPGHRPVAIGEHPRLLFRSDDLPALRARAATPEGRAILQRLRFLLDGAEGETMTLRFSPAKSADAAPPKPPPPGTWTIGHAAGYGLLYQLTGERKFAGFARECFERALAGVRDRDPRYSFRQPGGALRAGPTLGWLAVGYDLACGGWDAATRERLGRALLEYREELAAGRGEKSTVDLERLARGTMPPFSNHFPMQVGGAALVLLALHGEPWADPDRIAPLLEQARQGMVRTLSEGFGDGGMYAEGDGTGSMASQIVFLTALSAWRNAVGVDFFGVDRPNARMLSRRWACRTVFREGRPDFWPVRGGYPHNVWAREGMSGAGCFALGFDGLPPAERAALAWCYDRFLAAADARAGTPFDTASVYPQYAVASFVNWPVGQPRVDPASVWPKAWTDSVSGFFGWRDRWRDGDDTVITVLTSPVRGYMGAPADTAMAIQSGGRHLTWGRVTEGPVRHWETSPQGETSSLTLSDGTAFGVDLSGASGAGVLLVTSGEAEGQRVELGGATLRVFFPQVKPGEEPVVRPEGGAAVVGRQRLELRGGNIRFGVTGR